MLNEMLRSIAVCGSLFVLIKFILPLIFNKLKPKGPVQLKEKKWKKDTVYLYQMPEGTKSMPSASPFCIKVETFLRLHKISFERRNSIITRGENGKVPFIELNGEQIADSNVIISTLVKYFNIKEYETNEDASIGHVISSTVDFRTFNIFVHYKTTSNPSIFLNAMIGSVVPKPVVEWLTVIAGPILRNEMHRRISETFGHFTDAQFDEMVRKDLESYKGLIGEKKYLFGDKMTTADCTLFGHLAATFYLKNGSYSRELLTSEAFAPIARYIARIRDELFGNEFCT